MKRYTLEHILENPGIYAGLDDAVPCFYILVEVSEDGVIHQLNSKGERDGVLDYEGWYPSVWFTDYDDTFNKDKYLQPIL